MAMNPDHPHAARCTNCGVAFVALPTQSYRFCNPECATDFDAFLARCAQRARARGDYRTSAHFTRHIGSK